MTHHEQQNLEELEAAIRAIQSLAIDGPPEDLTTSTVEALIAHEQVKVESVILKPSRREKMFRFAKYSAFGTAVSLAAILVGSLLFISLTSHSAFAQVIQNVRDATAVKYRLVQKIGDEPELDCESSFSDGIVRTEVEGVSVFLADSQTRETLQLLPSERTAIHGKLDGNLLQQPLNISDAMKEMTVEDGELVESFTQDGKLIDVYRVSKLPSFMAGGGKLGVDDTFKLWVDRSTQLPTRIKLRTQVGPQNVLLSLEFSEFEWNPTFAPGLFDMTVPAGYQVLTGPNGN